MIFLFPLLLFNVCTYWQIFIPVIFSVQLPPEVGPSAVQLLPENETSQEAIQTSHITPTPMLTSPPLPAVEQVMEATAQLSKSVLFLHLVFL